MLYIIRELLGFQPGSSLTNINSTLQYLTNAIKKRCTAFVISDFIDSNFSNALTIANRKHDMVAVQVYDKREAELPSIGLMKVKDAETNKDLWIDTSSKKMRTAYSVRWLKRQDELKQVFTKSGVDSVSIATDDDYVKALMKLFKQRV